MNRSASRWWVPLLAVTLGLLLWSAGASRADEEIGRALLQSAKDAHDKKMYDEALTLLAKVADEAPELRETPYWAGSCHDKKGDTAAAVRSYRAFREVLAVAPEGEASKAELELLKKAQARLLALAPGEPEEEKLRAAFAADLLALAKSKEGKDPASALMVFDTLLRADPRHAEAGAAAVRLRTPPLRKGEFPLPPPFAAITDWKDMIATQALGVASDQEYANHLLTLTIGDRASPGPPIPLRVGARCALDMELRVLDAKVPNWAVGFALVDTAPPESRKMVGVTVEAKQMVAFRNTGTGPLLSLGSVPIGAVELKTWHRLTVQVAAPKLIVWVDGKKATQLAADGLGPETSLRLYVNRCKVEMRTLRWARME